MLTLDDSGIAAELLELPGRQRRRRQRRRGRVARRARQLLCPRLHELAGLPGDAGGVPDARTPATTTSGSRRSPRRGTRARATRRYTGHPRARSGARRRGRTSLGAHAGRRGSSFPSGYPSEGVRGAVSSLVRCRFQPAGSAFSGARRGGPCRGRRGRGEEEAAGGEPALGAGQRPGRPALPRARPRDQPAAARSPCGSASPCARAGARSSCAPSSSSARSAGARAASACASACPRSCGPATTRCARACARAAAASG